MKKSVLVVVDMQNDFIDGSLGTKEAQDIVPNVLKKIEGWEGPVFATKDIHHQNYLQTQEGKKLAVEHCIKGTKGWYFPNNINSALAAKGPEVVLKSTFGSFEELPGKIYTRVKRELGEDTGINWQDDVEIQLVGLCTDICVVSNALILKAYFPETSISVDASCCAGVTPEKHEAALLTMESCQINIIR